MAKWARCQSRIAADGVSIEKECRRCEQFKLLTDFRSQINAPLGVRSQCRECECATSKEHRLQNPEYYKNYRKENKYKISKQTVAWAREKKFGISDEEFCKMAENGCEVCGSYERLHVDHSHITNKVRGILCGKCNMTLGL